MPQDDITKLKWQLDTVVVAEYDERAKATVENIYVVNKLATPAGVVRFVQLKRYANELVALRNQGRVLKALREWGARGCNLLDILEVCSIFEGASYAEALEHCRAIKRQRPLKQTAHLYHAARHPDAA